MDIYIWKALSGKNVMLSDAYHDYEMAIAAREDVIDSWSKVYKLSKKVVTELKGDILYKAMPLEIMQLELPVKEYEAPKQFESPLPYKERVYGFHELRFHIIPDVDPFVGGECAADDCDNCPGDDVKAALAMAPGSFALTADGSVTSPGSPDKDADIAYKVMFSAEPYRQALWHVGSKEKFSQNWKVSLDESVDKWLVESGAVELDKQYPQFYRCKLNGKTLDQVAEMFRTAGFADGDFVHCGIKPKTEAERMDDLMQSASAYQPGDLYFEVKSSAEVDKKLSFAPSGDAALDAVAAMASDIVNASIPLDPVEDHMLVAFVPKKYYDANSGLFADNLLFSKTAREAMDKIGVPADGGPFNIFKLPVGEIDNYTEQFVNAGFVKLPQDSKEINKGYYFCVNDDGNGTVTVMISDAEYFDKNGARSDWELSEEIVVPACLEEEVCEGEFISTQTAKKTERIMLAAGFTKSAAFDKFLGVVTTPPPVPSVTLEDGSSAGPANAELVMTPVENANVYGADNVYYYLGDDLLVFVPKAHYNLYGTLIDFELDEQLQILLSVVDVTKGRLPGSWTFKPSEHEDIDRIVGKVGIDRNEKIAGLV